MRAKCKQPEANGYILNGSRAYYEPENEIKEKEKKKLKRIKNGKNNIFKGKLT